MDAGTIQILLDLLNPLHGSLDEQVTEQFTDERELDPPKDREYGVNVTWQMERDLTQAVMILENRKAALNPANLRAAIGDELRRFHRNACYPEADDTEVRLATDTILILCEVCDSEGRILRSNGGPDDIDCGECPACKGTGKVVIEVKPVTMDDLP